MQNLSLGSMTLCEENEQILSGHFAVILREPNKVFPIKEKGS